MSAKRNWHKGSCHCGEVNFECEITGEEEIRECTCSICTKTALIHLIMPNSRFKITKGKENLTHYKFNQGIADHMFCKTCGVKAFYMPRSNPDGWSVNARCLDEWGELPFKMVAPFDGKNWEQEKSIRHLSDED